MSADTCDTEALQTTVGKEKTKYTHTCDKTVTDGTCAVECNTGYSGAKKTWTCPKGKLEGDAPDCTASPRLLWLHARSSRVARQDSYKADASGALSTGSSWALKPQLQLGC